jgi:hypothetical protein
VLPDARQAGELEARLVPVYLLQRYQGEAVARLIGGGDFDYTSAGDIKAGIPSRHQGHAGRRCSARRWPPDRQPARRVPGAAGQCAGHPDAANRRLRRSREYFATRMGSVFDACRLPKRAPANRRLPAGRRPHQPRGMAARARPAAAGRAGGAGPGAAKTWKRDAVPASVIGGEAVQLASNWVVADSLLNCWTAASCIRRWRPKCGSRRASWRNGCRRIRARA